VAALAHGRVAAADLPSMSCAGAAGEGLGDKSTVHRVAGDGSGEEASRVGSRQLRKEKDFKKG
jgi:hypothetical protein